MGNSKTPQAKDPRIERDDNSSQKNGEEKIEPKSTFQLEGFQALRQGRPGCCEPCFKILFTLLAIFGILKSLAEIVLTITAAISTKLFSSEQSGRLVGMVLLALLAAVTISMLIYGLIAVFKKQQKPLHAAALVLVITAILQGVILGVAVHFGVRDEQQLNNSLEESFSLAKEDNPRQAAIWAATQSEFKCCGLNGPVDYRSANLPPVFPPNVPISCCSTYDSSRSDLVQEREREVCKARKSYYILGCQSFVVDSFRTSSHLVLGLTGSLIVLEVILAIIASILLRKLKRTQRQDPLPEKKRDECNL